VVVADGDTTIEAVASPAPVSAVAASSVSASGAVPVTAGLAGTIHQVLVTVGDRVEEGQVVCILEAMKMETEVRASTTGTVASIDIVAGDAVTVGQELMTLG
jgi:oxaloacetate decarboxylase alpha subunit